MCKNPHFHSEYLLLCQMLSYSARGAINVCRGEQPFLEYASMMKTNAGWAQLHAAFTRSAELTLEQCQSTPEKTKTREQTLAARFQGMRWELCMSSDKSTCYLCILQAFLNDHEEHGKWGNLKWFKGLRYSEHTQISFNNTPQCELFIMEHWVVIYAEGRWRVGSRS